VMQDDFRHLENDIVEIMYKIKALSLDTPLADAPRGEDGGEGNRTLEDVLGEEPNQETDIEMHELGATIDAALSGIPDREARILRMYFGLNASRHFTLEEIGVELNIPRERVRLLRDKALHHLLRNPASRRSLQPFLEAMDGA
jgi:RNA polymerase primary sigma factor